MITIERIVLPAKLPIGSVFQICNGVACMSFRVRRVQHGARGVVHSVSEVAGVLALDPMVIYYREQLARRVLPKVAKKRTMRKFRLKERAFYYRLAKR